MNLIRYAFLLTFTGAACYVVGDVLYTIGSSRMLYLIFFISGTVCILAALVLAGLTQRRLTFEQAQSVARMRALERQLEAMIQEEVRNRD